MEYDDEAYGMVETRGLVAALEAADAMLKSSDVRLVARTRVDAALITVQVAGEVAAVRAAVEAGRRAAERVGVVVASHVIARPAARVREIMSVTPKKKSASHRVPPPAALEANTVQELRRLARALPESPLQGRALARATRQQLLDLLSP